MTHDHQHGPGCSKPHNPMRFAWLIYLTLAGIVVLYLLEYHWQHTIGVLPYLILLLCPLMHFFMPHGHHHHNEKIDTPKS